MRISRKQISYFIAIIDNDMCVSKAANMLGLSQGCLSNALSIIEQDRKSVLFKRKGRSLTGLTPLGVDIERHARRAIDRIETIESMLDRGRTRQ